MANIARVQTATGTSTGSYVNSLQLNFTQNVSVTNLITVAIVTSTNSSTSVSTVTDSLGNTYTKAIGKAGTTGLNLGLYLYYCANCVGGTTPVITITLVGGEYDTVSAVAAEHSGIATSSVLDQTAFNVETSYVQVHSTGYTGTTAQNNELAIAVYGCTSPTASYTVANGYSTPVPVSNTGAYTAMVFADKVLSSTASSNTTFSTAAYVEGLGVLLTFKGSSSTVTNPIPDAPIYVCAAVDTNRAYVSWNAPKTIVSGGFNVDTGITSFTIKRATSSGGSYTTLSSSLTVPYYDDTTVSNGTTYYYVVTATSNGGTSANSTEAVAVVATPTAHADAWYSYGYQPTGVTQSTMRTWLRAHWDKIVTYMFTQSGAQLGGWGGYRPQVPDQKFYNSYGYFGTVSEGVGYSMIGSVYLGNPQNPVYDVKARAYFNGLMIYYKYYRDVRGLMHWDINSDGTIADFNGATDGDLDIAFALCMAHRLWGSSGTVNYLAEAQSLIAAIKQYEFLPASFGANQYLITNGDGWNMTVDLLVAPDYIRMAYFTIFGYHTSDATYWQSVHDRNLSFVNTYFTSVYSTGLVPDACDRNGQATNLYDWGKFQYSYNSIRQCWGFTLDYLWNGTTGIYNHMKKFADTAYITKAGSNNANVANIKAGPYDMNWTSDAGYTNQTFLAGVGSASCVQSSTASFAGAVATWVHNNGVSENSYFGLFQGFMNLLLMSGEMTPTFGTIPPPPTPPPTTPSFSGGAFLLNII